MADELLQAQTKAEIQQAENKYGHNYLDKKNAEVFDNFVRQFVANSNQRQGNSTVFKLIHAPRQLWTFSKGNTYQYQEPIARVHVYQVTSWFDGKKYDEIENKRIRRISIN